MPIVSQFYGVLIYIYREKQGRHHLPHFHAKYAEYEGVYDFEGNLLEGNLPRKQHKMAEVWALLHGEELHAAWVAWNESNEIIKIDGLR